MVVQKINSPTKPYGLKTPALKLSPVVHQDNDREILPKYRYKTNPNQSFYANQSALMDSIEENKSNHGFVHSTLISERKPISSYQSTKLFNGVNHNRSFNSSVMGFR